MRTSKKQKLILKEWSEMDKPREKAIEKGLDSLSNSELIAIILRTGNNDDTAVELARQILQKAHNNLMELSKMNIHQLKNSFKGIGPTKAITLLAALELGRRSALENAQETTHIQSSKDIFALFEPIIGHLSHEEFWILLLSHSHRVIDYVQISQGGTTATVVDVKLIIKQAIEQLASSIAICHNHPSGNLHASREDQQITKKINDACKAMDIVLIDHLIIGHKNYYSFADNNLL